MTKFIDLIMRLQWIIASCLVISILTQPTSGYGVTGTYRNLSNADISIDAYENKPLIIEAIQTTCSACNDPDHRSIMNALYTNFNGQVEFVILSINSQDTIQLMSDFVNKFHIQWNAGLDYNNILTSQLGVAQTPTTILLDDTGENVRRWVGHYSLSNYAEELNRLVDDPVSIDTTYTDPFTDGDGSGSSIIGNIFGNPIFQIALIGTLILMIYFRSTKST